MKKELLEHLAKKKHAGQTRAIHGDPGQHEDSCRPETQWAKVMGFSSIRPVKASPQVLNFHIQFAGNQQYHTSSQSKSLKQPLVIEHRSTAGRVNSMQSSFQDMGMG